MVKLGAQDSEKGMRSPLESATFSRLMNVFIEFSNKAWESVHSRELRRAVDSTNGRVSGVWH
jgi:hypothetical protein